VAKLTLTVPDIGGAEDAEVIELYVKPGDAVAVEQSLIVLESDKASMDIPAEAAGTVVELLCKEGDTLAEGDPILVLETAGDVEEVVAAPESEPATAEREPPEPDSEPAPAAPAEPESVAAAAPAEQMPAEEGEAPAAAPVQVAAGASVYAGPAVRKLAREFGVDLEHVAGSGPRGRIVKEDLQSFVKHAIEGGGPAAGGVIPAVPETDFSAFGPVDLQPLTKMDKLTGANMQRSWLNVPHVTQFDEIDVSELEDFRADLKAEAEARGVRLTPLPFIMKACAIALRDNPRLNASLAGDGEHIVYKQYVHIGMAVDTPAGLLVPVVRDVDGKGLWELAEETAELADRARERKLKPIEMQGGCFSISSLGGIGGTGFTPIINTPEVAILGVSRLTVKPVWDGAAFVPRKLLPVALSYDHRVVNGGDGGRFVAQLGQLLGDIRRLLL
jgi:pyruvate dehydrogenase E2 component (dihydrolipoamide acetyltransferase)